MREHRFLGTFELVTPLRLGAGDQADLADSAVWRQASGAVIIPGTSLAGAFRGFLERLTRVDCRITDGVPRRLPEEEPPCGCILCALFGDVRPGKDPSAHASRVTFQDSVVEGANVRIVDGVAMDRRRRAASDARRFDFEEVAPGAQLSIEVRGSALSDEELTWLGAAFHALGSGHIALGGRVAQGFGRVETRALSLRWRDTERPEHLVAAVLNQAGSEEAWPESVEPFPGEETEQPGRWEVRFLIAAPPLATFLVADPLESVFQGFDRAPRGGVAAPELPATSLRGVLRSAAERILRTLDPGAACDPTEASRSCAAREREAAKQKKACPRCLACQLFGNEEWASWIRLEVRPISRGGPGQPFDHVAIDRFTGGASEGRKFDAVAATNAEYEVRLSAGDVPEAERNWVTGLLALALQDLHQGRVTLGHGSARGHGWFAIKDPPDFPDPIEDGIRALWKKVGLPFPEVA